MAGCSARTLSRSLANSSGVLPMDSPEMDFCFSRESGMAMALCAAALSLSMMGRGVPGEDARPSQEESSTVFTVSLAAGASGISG